MKECPEDDPEMIDTEEFQFLFAGMKKKPIIVKHAFPRVKVKYKYTNADSFDDEDDDETIFNLQCLKDQQFQRNAMNHKWVAQKKRKSLIKNEDDEYIEYKIDVKKEYEKLVKDIEKKCKVIVLEQHNMDRPTLSKQEKEYYQRAKDNMEEVVKIDNTEDDKENKVKIIEAEPMQIVKVKRRKVNDSKNNAGTKSLVNLEASKQKNESLFGYNPGDQLDSIINLGQLNVIGKNNGLHTQGGKNNLKKYK